MCGVCKPTQEIRGTVTGYVLSGPSCNNKSLAPKYRNISDLSDTEIHFTGVARVHVDPPAALLWTCKQETVFQWEAPSVVAFQWLSTLLTASLECSDLDSTTYSQIEAVLDPVEVAKSCCCGKMACWQIRIVSMKERSVELAFLTTNSTCGFKYLLRKHSLHYYCLQFTI